MSQVHHTQRGSTLIESLVAVLVLALGVMGMASVQTRTLTTARTTTMRATAMRAVDDLLERMQANPGTRPSSGQPNLYITPWGPPPLASDCASASCNGAQLAAFDLAQWKAALARELPAGDALVFASDTDRHQFGVLVAWKEARTAQQVQAPAQEAELFVQSVAVRDATGQQGTGVEGKACPALHTCHLVYIRP